MNFQEYPHRRYNPLQGEWVKVSPHRTKRPWQGQVEKPQIPELASHDPSCYLCPGNERAGGNKNPNYTGTYVFDNDFAALLPEVPKESLSEGPGQIIQAENERGICRVICFSPRHDMTLSRMDSDAVEKVVELWKEQYLELGEKPFINHIQIFENRGAIMGCSNPHPHGQIWAEEHIPDIPARELIHQIQYYEKHGTSMLTDYAEYELREKVRIIIKNEHFAALVPFWAVWPFEVMILPLRPVSALSDLNAAENSALSSLIRRLGIRLDNLFQTSFPYSMGIHQAPTNGNQYPMVQLHFHYYPPLLRSAAVRKFMVGYELLAMPQRDITAEASAQKLREQPEKHFMERA
ncbi:MAG: UDP-glucose--hexose-1-phosphate uridylyltransferase [Spirochaetales bacterium]|jgi:UDPglucose--hexose-1-phosphate uridylyltransferase|nr:UDP-glucose--hexose-1-phosphate uridylyltransferase [Spirochaetales bacterium]